MQANLAPEDELCLLLSRSRLSPDVERRALELLSSPLRWPQVLEHTYHQQILPLLFHRLQALQFPGVPEAVVTELGSAFRRNAMRNVVLADELARVLRLLAAAGIPVLPLKGVFLAESLYGNPDLRVCADTDILVPPKFFPATLGLLEAENYHSSIGHPRMLGLLARYEKDCGLMRQDRSWSFPLQVHVGLIWGGPVEHSLLEQVWAEAVRKDIHGAPALALSAEWEFLYLAVHAARHGLAPLKWLVDIDQLCSSGSVDWESASRKARRLGWEKIIRQVLGACGSLLDTPIPAPFSVPKGPAPCAIPQPETSRLHIPRDLFFSVRLLRSSKEKLRYLAVRLFVPTAGDYRFLPLPTSLFFLYGVLRPVRLACQVGWWLVQAGVERLSRSLRPRQPISHHKP